jgi:hypothetical protein
MGLLDDFTPPEPKIGACKVRTIANTLDEKDAAILLAAVEGSAWKIEQLANSLKEKGLFISPGVLIKHRTKGCSCSRI